MVGPTEWSFSSTVDSSEGLKRQESLVSLERLPLARSPNLTALTVAYLFRMGQWSDNEQVGGCQGQEHVIPQDNEASASQAQPLWSVYCHSQ